MMRSQVCSYPVTTEYLSLMYKFSLSKFLLIDSVSYSYTELHKLIRRFLKTSKEFIVKILLKLLNNCSLVSDL